MIKVKKLEYSNEDFKNTLGSVTPIQDEAKKMDLDPFPSTADLVTFANKVYSDKDDELCSGLPKGWELLTAAYNSTGYFGCLYFNPLQQQIVLAHRGTKLSSLGAVVTDIIGVGLNQNTEYMFSAVTFGDKIKRAILVLNKQDGVRFTLTITGYSLGGWISQVTAITLKHLKKQENSFVRVSNIDEGIHAHTVVFDSPGVQDMAIKIQREYLSGDFNPYSIFRSLDISNFVIAVNRVNITGYHVGTMYQIFRSNLVCTSEYNHALSNISKHGIKNFIDAFGDGDMTLSQVKGWPKGQKLDLRKSVRLHCFSEAELDFFNFLKMEKRNEIKNSEIEKFFKTKHLFPDFTKNRKENTVTLDSELDSKNFVKNIKNALRWFSGGLQDMMKEIKLTVPSILLKMFSQECLDSIPDLPDCEDPFRLCEFTNNTARVLYVQAADCSLEMARIYNILYNSYPDIDQCIFLDWKSLLKMSKYLTTKGLPLNNNCNLFVINIGSTTLTRVKDILKNMFSKFKEHSEKKAVIISQKNSDFFRFVKSFEPELAIRCLPLSEEECLEFTFNDLKEQSRRELLSKEFINLGKQAMSLNALLGEDCQSSASIDDVLKTLLKDLLTDESYSLNIPNNLLKFNQLDVMFSKINREVNMASLAVLLHEETCSLVASRDVWQLLEPLLQEMPGATERVLDVSRNSEEDFRQICLENSSINVAYWLAATNGRFILKEVFNRSFYLSRQFRNQSRVDLEELVQYKNDIDLFIFVGVTDKETLMHYLNASPEVEKLFCTNLKFKCFQNSTTAENAEEIDRCINKHTIEVVKEEGGYLLVWRDSQGSLDSLLPCLSKDSRWLSEDDLCAHKVVIISDLPGMGKSTTLTSLSHHLVNSWVFRINLRDRPADITNLREQMSIKSVAQFLAGASSELAPVVKATLSLLRFCLQSQGSQQIHILLDGFDEIRDKEAVEKILKLCHFLKNETTAKIIVTTRDNYKDVLVNRLSTVATIFEKITEEIQLSFLVNFWHSHVVLGQKDERLRLFAQHLYEAAHKKLGDDAIRLIGIPLHMTMLAEAFLQQAEQFSRNAETIPNIIGMNNVYNLFKKFTSVKRDIYFKDKILMGSDVMGGFNNMLYDKIMECHCILAFQIIDSEFAKKYLGVITSEDEFKEMNRFGLTQWNRKTHCDFIHRTFAEYFCSQLLVLWLRRENFRYKHLPIEEWFVGNLLINKDFKVVRKFIDEHLAEVTLTEESKQLLYDNMSKCWSKDAAAFCDENGKTALHMAVEEENPNIIDLLLGGLATEQTQEAFESFLLARDYEGKTALKRGLISLIPKQRTYVFGSNLPIEKGIKQMLNITHLSYELKYKLLLYTLLEGHLLPLCSEFLLTCALNEKDQEDIQRALTRIEVLQSEVDYPWEVSNYIENFINIAERKFLPLAIIHDDTAINIECSAGNYKLVTQFIQINRDVVNSRDGSRRTPLQHAAERGHIKLVELLHQQGARLNDYDDRGRTALYRAVDMGKQDIVKYLLKHGADSNLSDDGGMSPLHCAIDGGCMAIVKYFISQVKVDINCLDNEGKTPLHYAIEKGSKEIVKYLVSEVKVAINCLDNEGCTPLIDALESHSWQLAEYLLDSGADANISDRYDKTPLMYAVEKIADLDCIEKPSRLDIVKKLISLNKDITTDINKSDIHGKTLLHYAIGGGHMKIVKYLISEVKVDINCLDNEGKTPLYYAIVRGHKKMVEYLISEVKVAINCLDNDGCTPLIYALESRRCQLAEYLLDSGADPNILNRYDKTPLMYAVEKMADLDRIEKPSRLDIVKKLISLSKDITTDINKSDTCGKTLLHYAIGGGREEIVKYLISEVKVDINCLDNEGKTPLHYAIEKGSKEIVKYLVSEVKVAINCLDNEGCTPLIDALESHRWQLAEYLLDSGADANILNRYDKTPLMYAVERMANDWIEKPSRLDIVKNLISVSKDITDINKSDTCGKTLLHYAIRGGNKEIVKYLISEVKVDINCLYNEGKTPLIYAIVRGHKEIIKYLISEVKVDVNCLDNEGKTPLIYALLIRNWRLAEYLLDSGADPNISNCNDKTPLMYAVEAIEDSYLQKPLKLDIVERLTSGSKDITMDIFKSDRHRSSQLIPMSFQLLNAIDAFKLPCTQQSNIKDHSTPNNALDTIPVHRFFKRISIIDKTHFRRNLFTGDISKRISPLFRLKQERGSFRGSGWKAGAVPNILDHKSSEEHQDSKW